MSPKFYLFFVFIAIIICIGQFVITSLWFVYFVGPEITNYNEYVDGYCIILGHDVERFNVSTVTNNLTTTSVTIYVLNLIQKPVYYIESNGGNVLCCSYDNTYIEPVTSIVSISDSYANQQFQSLSTAITYGNTVLPNATLTSCTFRLTNGMIGKFKVSRSIILGTCTFCFLFLLSIILSILISRSSCKHYREAIQEIPLSTQPSLSLSEPEPLLTQNEADIVSPVIIN